MRDHFDQLGDASVAVVTFAPIADLAAYHRHLRLPFPVLSDSSRTLYRRFDLGRASWRAVYGLGTLRMYARLIRQGWHLQRPSQDTRQLGGDVVLDGQGRLAALFRPGSPDDRPAIEELVEAVRRSR